MKNVKLSFIVRTNKIKNNGNAPIYLRIVVDKKRKEISTKKEVDPAKWCTDKQRVKGNLEKTQNNYLFETKE